MQGKMEKSSNKVLRKFNSIKNNRSKRRTKKIVKLEVAEDEVKPAIDEESDRDEEENTCPENEENASDSDEDHRSVDSESDKNQCTDGSSDENEDEESEAEEEKIVTAPKRKRRKKTKYNAAEEARLEKLVFGDPGDVINKLPDLGDSMKKNDAKTAISLPKSLQDSDDSDFEPLIKFESDDESIGSGTGNNVAWVDESDVGYTVQKALKERRSKIPHRRPEKTYTELLENRFTQLVGNPKWASLDAKPEVDDEDADSDDAILQRSNHLVVSKVKKLRKGTIDIKALTDINKSTQTEGPVTTSVQFHPTSTVAIVAGLSGVLSLFQVDGRENAKLQSIRFDKFRINCAKFLREGCEVILGSRDRAYSQAYDLMSGKTYKVPLPHGVTNMQNFEVSPDGKFIAIVGKMGQIHLLSSTTKEIVATFQMNTKCLALAFCPSSEKLVSHGDGEQMYVWDLKSRSCVHKVNDDGCIAGSALAFSPSGQFLATGSKQGVVNVYETESVMGQTNPKPLKIVLNLVTPISTLKFNPTSEILAMASKFKENAFRMLHIPSFTVFSNFPTFQTKMYNPLDVDFSPSSGYLGVSNDKGHAYLYRLKHYGNY